VVISPVLCSWCPYRTSSNLHIVKVYPPLSVNPFGSLCSYGCSLWSSIRSFMVAIFAYFFAPFCFTFYVTFSEMTPKMTGKWSQKGSFCKMEVYPPFYEESPFCFHFCSHFWIVNLNSALCFLSAWHYHTSFAPLPSPQTLQTTTMTTSGCGNNINNDNGTTTMNNNACNNDDDNDHTWQ